MADQPENVSVPAQSGISEEQVQRAEKDRLLHQALLDLPYKEIVAFSHFLRAHTPFATKHGVKGEEFDTVLVVLDDKGAAWNLYSFDKYLGGEDRSSNPARFARSRNVFYVCCSRAERNLAVIDAGVRSKSKDTGAVALFGASRCFYI